jgi:glucosamine--fructose-6-phosphate aminotransferase (isomerizing)
LPWCNYRGYDSAGLAVRDGELPVQVVKAKGRLKVLDEKTDGGAALYGTCGIGHTRWATHGEPSENNAHPHISDDGNVTGVHNGIIENYQELKDKLVRKGYTFYSSTDTEVAIKLIDYYYKKYEGTPVDAINHAMVRIRGSYALAVMFQAYPDEIYVARKDSPMILGVEDGASYIASDVPAILKYTRNVYYIGNLEMARVRKGEITFYNLDGEEIQKEKKHIEWDAEAAEKGGYEHFMMKEIHEQPKAVADTLNSVLKNDAIDLTEVGLTDADIEHISQIYIVACGSAYHVGMAAQYVMEDLARIPVRVELASEFRYRRPILDKNALAIIVSQSGETADSLAALREAKEHGVRTLGIVNVVGSSIAREADNVFYTLAGPEISVATTKPSLLQPTRWQFSLQRFVAKLQTSSTRHISKNSRPSRIRSARFWRQGADPVVCGKTGKRERCILHRPRHRLCHLPGRQSQDERNQLHPFRSLCSR